MSFRVQARAYESGRIGWCSFSSETGSEKTEVRERRLFLLGKSNKRIYLASARMFFPPTK